MAEQARPCCVLPGFLKVISQMSIHADRPPTNAPAVRPASVARNTDPFLIALAIMAAYYFFTKWNVTETQLAMMLVATVTVLMAAIEIAYAPWCKKPAPHLETKTWLTHSAIKWLGTMAGLGLVLFAWWLLPEYHRPLYRPVKQAAWMLLPYVPALSAIYILLTQKRLGLAEDDDWYLGMLLLGKTKSIEWHRIRDGLLVWFVKGFFLPLNFSSAVVMLKSIRTEELPSLSTPWLQMVAQLDVMIFCTLVISIIPGYLLSSRLLGTEIRKIDHSWFGWMVTLACYPPFLHGVFTSWLNYHGKNHGSTKPWAMLSADTPYLQYILGGGIILMGLVHYWGEAIFNLRASNLSHRGIITNGPFRFTKHPVYVSKCAGWLLLWLPFAQAGSWLNNLRLTILWCGVCILLGLRGLAEEKLLSQDPDYDAYALWVDKHGIFKWVGKIYPPLSYAYRRKYWTQTISNT
jgi:protein-S-isoprenylcysteine O-methyltransferase Ste14